MPLRRLLNHTTSSVTIYNSAGRPVEIPARTKDGPGEKQHVDLSDKAVARVKRIRGVVVTDHEVGEMPQTSQRSTTDQDHLRTDGPTLQEFVAAGYSAENYPPSGYTDKRTAEEKKPKVETEIETEKSKRAQADALLADYRDEKITYAQFVAGSKKLLGDEWPGGTPKKSVLLSLLENIKE